MAATRKLHGDAPLVLWDQYTRVTYNNLADVLFWDKEEKRLYLGGFHVNGSHFERMEEYYNDNEEHKGNMKKYYGDD